MHTAHTGLGLASLKLDCSLGPFSHYSCGCSVDTFYDELVLFTRLSIYGLEGRNIALAWSLRRGNSTPAVMYINTAMYCIVISMTMKASREPVVSWNDCNVSWGIRGILLPDASILAKGSAKPPKTEYSTRRRRKGIETTTVHKN